MTSVTAAAGREFALEPPDDDHVEVSLFGARVGECCVIHAGHGRWLVIDSLKAPDSDDPVALAYLAELGVDPQEAIRLVVASHWHKDHVGGISDVLAAAPAARFCCSPVIGKKEFLAIVGGAARSYQRRSPMHEVDCAIRLMEAAAKAGRKRLHVGIAGRSLTPAGLGDVEIVALSPSDTTWLKAVTSLGRLVPQAGRRFRLPTEPDANWRSVAAWVRIGDVNLLLGADLEQSNASGAGWGEVLEDWDDSRHPVTVFKVPHHGSAGADESGVWTRILAPGAWCLVTPYGPSNLPLPRDQERLCGRSERTWLAGALHDIDDAADPELAQAFTGPDSAVRRVAGTVGQVRLRAPMTATDPEHWKIDVRFPAGSLCGADLPR